LLGGNGSGKSTLAHIMVGNYRDFQGEVLYSGKKNVNVASIKNNISYVNQDTFLFHDSIVNNIVMGCEHVTEEKLYEVCVVAGVDEMVREFPEGYNHVICDNGANLSGGQKQKIAMARALLRDTAIYIFDESSSNMDVVSEHNFMRIISEYLAEKTVIVISHNKMFREFANKVYKIEGGRLLSC